MTASFMARVCPVFFVLVFFVAFFPVRAAADLSPEFVRGQIPRVQTQAVGVSELEWKTLWDRARVDFHRNDLQQSLARYHALLAMRPRLEEAKWEAVLVEAALKHWQQVEKELRELIDISPGRFRYTLLLADVLWQTGQLERAAELFERVLVQGGSDPATIQEVLRSLAAVSMEQGKKEKAFELWLRLYAARPDDLALRRKLALLAFDLKKYDAARHLLTDLVSAPDADKILLIVAAQTHENLGQINHAIVYLERIVARSPGDKDVRETLAYSYEKLGRITEAIHHFSVLLEGAGGNIALRLHMGELQLRAGHPERALLHLEKYLKKKPTDAVVRARAQAIRSALANDLLDIVENVGALAVWKELARKSPSRLGIYRAMAELLRKKNRSDELVEVLEIIHAQVPKDASVQEQLALLYLARGEPRRAGRLLEELAAAGHASAVFLEARARLHEGDKRYALALADLETILDYFPEQYETRARCVVLAGRLGRADSFHRHLALLEKEAADREAVARMLAAPEFQLAIAAAHMQTGAYRQAYRVCRGVFEQAVSATVPDAVTAEAARLGMARAYVAHGLVFEAERLLRMAVDEDGPRGAYLLELARIALSAYRLDDAAAWIRLAAVKPAVGAQSGAAVSPALDATGVECALLDALITEKRGFFQDAMGQLRDLHDRMGKAAAVPAAGGKTAPALVERVAAELARMYLIVGRTEEAAGILAALPSRASREPSLTAAELLLLAGQEEYAERQSRLYEIVRQGGKDPVLLMEAVAVLETAGEEDRIYGLLREGLARFPDSFVLSLRMQMELEKKGRIDLALEHLRAMMTRFPDRSFLATRYAHLLAKEGDLDGALDIVQSSLAHEDRNWPRRDLIFLQGRILRMYGMQKDAAQTAAMVLQPSVDKTLADLLKNRGIMPRMSQVRRSLWELFSFSPREELTLSRTLFAVPAPETIGKKNEASALANPLYDLYRWQLVFQKEFSSIMQAAEP